MSYCCPQCMVMSEKICIIIDIFLIGLFIGSTELSSLNLMSPLLYFTGIFYILFGQGGSILALRAKQTWMRKNQIFISRFQF